MDLYVGLCDFALCDIGTKVEEMKIEKMAVSGVFFSFLIKYLGL